MSNSTPSDAAQNKARARLIAAIAGAVFALPFLGGATYRVFNESPACAEKASEPEHGSATITLKPNGEGAYQLEYEAKPEHPPETCFNGHTAEEWIAILTAFLVGFTGPLATFTLLLWWETRAVLLDAKSNSDRQALEFKQQFELSLHAARATTESATAATRSADALVTAQRPWLGAEVSVIGAERLGDKFVWVFHAKCENVGQTPARNVRITIGVASQGVGLPWDFAEAIARAEKAMAQMGGRKGHAIFPREPESEHPPWHKEAVLVSEVEASAGTNELGFYALMVCVLAHYEFAGGSGVTRRQFILSRGAQRYFLPQETEIEGEDVVVIRVPLNEKTE